MEVSQPFVARCGSQRLCLSNPIATPFAVRYSPFAADAVLNLKVCDAACGSGHFLIAAAHRIARRLAG
jgi:2-polyprenyl-3-methyl-5-hydroxy-6-metoxy-1,4-benzoquinol methylase